MIWWITGNTGAGKSTLAKRIAGAVVLDGDELRTVWTDLDLSDAGRCEQNLRAARLAAILSAQGHDVVVSTICPYRELRKRVKDICGCRFVYVPGGAAADAEHPYETFDQGAGI